jgi:DNA-binding NarL/FixJ family response regulator
MLSSTTLSERPRVLVVDDNRTVLARAALLLSEEFTVVGTAQDGYSALEAARELEPDVIVLDISMPGLSGLEVATRLRAARSTATIVFLTVHTEEEVIEAAAECGGIGYVTKPRLGSDLIFAVREAKAGRPFVSATA